MWQHSGLSEVQTMSEYIERGALLEEVESLTITVTGMREGANVLREVLTMYREAVLSEIKDAPAADVVEVKRGYNLNDIPSLFECSVCHWECYDTCTGDTDIYNYCPNCGAKMDGE